MALRKKMMTKLGVTANYWTISTIRIDKDAKTAEITLVPHLSDTAPGVEFAKRSYRVKDIVYQEPYEEKTSTDYTDFFSPRALDGKDIYDVAYQYVKTHIPDFAGAKDV